MLRVSASLYTVSNTRHGQTLPRDTLGAAFRGRTHPDGRKRFALTLWRCVGTVGTPATDTIVVYARPWTGLPQPLAGWELGASSEGLLLALQWLGSVHSPATCVDDG